MQTDTNSYTVYGHSCTIFTVIMQYHHIIAQYLHCIIVQHVRASYYAIHAASIKEALKAQEEAREEYARQEKRTKAQEQAIRQANQKMADRLADVSTCLHGVQQLLFWALVSDVGMIVHLCVQCVLGVRVPVNVC